MKFLNNNDDLITIIVLNILLVFFVFILNLDAIRIIIGLPILLFFPGYSLVAVLFTRKDSIGPLERFTLSFGMSLFIVPGIGLILNYTPWGIRLLPIFVSLSIFIIAMCVVAFYLRSVLPEDERFKIGFANRLLARFMKKSNSSETKFLTGVTKSTSLLDKALDIILAVTIVVTVGTLTYSILSKKSGEKFSEFYILGSEGKAADYSTEVFAGDNVTVTLGIINREQSPSSYNFAITDNGTGIGGQNGINLCDDEMWEQLVSFVPDKIGDNQKIEFVLFKNDETVPYLMVHFWINVK